MVKAREDDYGRDTGWRTRRSIIPMIEKSPSASEQILQLGRALLWGLFCLVSTPVCSCTVFVLTDTTRTLLCDNEDWSNPKTRIWFVPADNHRFGCFYDGFDKGTGQGGMNTEGLAFGVVSGYEEQYKPDPTLPRFEGYANPLRVLETCSTVQQAIAFFKNHQEPLFARAKILIADRTGASVMMGAKEGKLVFESQTQCCGFGYGERLQLELLLNTCSEPTMENAAAILRATLQTGEFATKYSHVFDLTMGNVILYPSAGQEDHVKLNLNAELQKGGHYYDMSQIREQLSQVPRPLLEYMKRTLLTDFSPIPDQEPEITSNVRIMLEDAANGRMRPYEFTPEFWKIVSSERKSIQDHLRAFGTLASLVLVGRDELNGHQIYTYHIEFRNATDLQQITFDSQKKVADIKSKDTKWKPALESTDKPSTSAATGGVGLRLRGENESAPLSIDGVIDGSPAKRAGIKEGGLLVSINDRNTSGMTLQQVVEIIRGEPGTKLKVEIADPILHETNTFTLTRQLIQAHIGVTKGRD